MFFKCVNEKETKYRLEVPPGCPIPRRTPNVFFTLLRLFERYASVTVTLEVHNSVPTMSYEPKTRAIDSSACFWTDWSKTAPLNDLWCDFHGFCKKFSFSSFLRFFVFLKRYGGVTVRSPVNNSAKIESYELKLWDTLIYGPGEATEKKKRIKKRRWGANCGGFPRVGS